MLISTTVSYTNRLAGFTVPTGGGLDDYLGPLRRLVKVRIRIIIESPSNKTY